MSAVPTFELIVCSPDLLPAGRFRVFARRCGELQTWTVTLHVIGESSLVVVERDRRRLAELVTCGGSHPTFPSLARAALTAPGGSATVELPAQGYSGRMWLETEGPVPVPTSDLLLEHRFGDPEALTRIAADATDGALRLTTWHEYPEFGCWLRSESSFRARTGAG